MMLVPWLAWLAAITSLVLLAFRSTAGDTRRSWLLVLWIWFLAAAYVQFFARSAVESAIGLASQTLLAVGLLAWWKSEG